MPDGLTATDPAALPPPRPSTASITVQVLVVLLVFAVAGAVCGLIWFWVWSPPTGTVVRRAWYPDETGLRGEFRGTGWYVVVAAAAGLLLGVLTSWLLDRSELATLAAVTVGSILAAWLMREVGQHLGPADPQVLARTTSATRLPDELRESGWAPLTVFPFAALLGLCMVYLLTSGRREPGLPPPRHG